MLAPFLSPEQRSGAVGLTPLLWLVYLPALRLLEIAIFLPICYATAAPYLTHTRYRC